MQIMEKLLVSNLNKFHHVMISHDTPQGHMVVSGGWVGLSKPYNIQH